MPSVPCETCGAPVEDTATVVVAGRPAGCSTPHTYPHVTPCVECGL